MQTFISKLPDKIKVKVKKTKHGNYYAELPEYDVFTESDNLEELNYYINDLIYTLFDIPKKYHGKIWYRKISPHPWEIIESKTSPLEKFITPNILHA